MLLVSLWASYVVSPFVKHFSEFRAKLPVHDGVDERVDRCGSAGQRHSQGFQLQKQRDLKGRENTVLHVMSKHQWRLHSRGSCWLIMPWLSATGLAEKKQFPCLSFTCKSIGKIYKLQFSFSHDRQDSTSCLIEGWLFALSWRVLKYSQATPDNESIHPLLIAFTSDPRLNMIDELPWCPVWSLCLVLQD